jgi:CRISPR/Cas system-associated exonuclease Cas4 (RecB family)
MSNIPIINEDTDTSSRSLPAEAASIDTLIDLITNQSFTDWYREQQYADNILNGNEYFNGPSPTKPPDRHTPSKLLKCHRKTMYARQNAAREGTSPDGLFWFGTQFEEEVIVPYLQDIVPDNMYIQNSLWMDTTIEHDGEEVQLRGSTDPAIVTSDADPVLLTEIKTTSSLDRLSSPKEYHKAQLRAYLHALDETHEYPIETGLLVYASRKTLNLKVFTVTFDADFWERVVEWMVTQTQYERAGDLPPANPERDWECNYCSFKHRCGESDEPYSDMPVDGLLPLFDEYEKSNLVEYLDAPNRDAKLTPTLAHAYPELVDEYNVFSWSCPLGHTYAWDAVDWDGDVSNPPHCSKCAANEDGLFTLSGPEPADQH